MTTGGTLDFARLLQDAARLLCLVLPLTLFTLFLRTLALGAVAVEGMGARASVRRGENVE